jgi:tetratricopeptide (TPR) repeat protein
VASTDVNQAAPRDGFRPLVDRERERAELEQALREARAGRGHMLFLAGEPGIGKTRLAEHTADLAAQEGMVVAWGHCWENGAPAFWPWPRVIRALAREREPAELRLHLGPGAPWVAQLVPELAAAVPDLDPVPSLESAQARFALFDALTTFVASTSRATPTLIVLDDLHVADPGSLLALEFLAREIRNTSAFVLGTTQDLTPREDSEAYRLLVELGREGRRIPVGGLDRESIAELIQHRGGMSRGRGAAETLHAATAGNPFFVVELARLLAVEEDPERPPGHLTPHVPLPDTVRETIQRRLTSISPQLRELLEIASVIGTEFQVTTLASVASSEPDAVMRILDEGIAANLVVPHGVTRFRFAHGLLRETLYEALPAARRIELHRAVGSALERVYGPDHEDRLDSLAHHFLEAAPAGDVEKAVGYALRAGRKAMRLLAFEQAANVLRVALEVNESLQPDASRRAELLLALGEAQVDAGDPAWRDTLLAAAAVARQIDHVDVLARVGLAFRAFALTPGVPDQQLIALIEESLDRLGDADPALRACLLARLAVALYYSTSPAGATRREALVDEAISIARQLRDPDSLASVLANGQFATWGPDTTERSLEWATELVGLAERRDNRELALVACNRRIDLLLELGNVAEADIAVTTLERLADGNPEPRAAAYVPLQRGRRAALEGRYREAEELQGKARDVADRLRDPAVTMVAAGELFGIRWAQGRIAELEPEARAFADRAPGMPVWRAGLALILTQLGRDAEARRELERLVHEGACDMPRDNVWLLAVALLSEACSHLGDRRRAAVLYEHLAPLAARNVVSPHAIFAGPASLYLAILATTMGESELAAEHLETAAEAAARIGAGPVLDRIASLRKAQPARARAEPARAGAEPARGRAEPATQPPDSAHLRREGDVWAFEYAGRTVRVRHSKGIGYLAYLLARPGVEVAALDLIRVDQPAPSSSGTHAAAEGLEVQTAEEGTGPLLDSEAKAAYRERLESLREDVEEAELFNDPERAARAKAEMDFVARELAGAVGLSGRDRKRGSTAERARVNVTRTIRSALGRVAEHDAELAHELETTIRTGTFCSHVPDPRRPLSWVVDGR